MAGSERGCLCDSVFIRNADRQVCSFTAGTGKHHQSNIGELFCAFKNLFLSHILHLGLGYSPVLDIDTDFRPLVFIFYVEIDNILVDLESGALQALQKRDHIGGIGKFSGTSASVNRIGGRPAEYIQLFNIGKRQRVVLVLQQDDAFFCNFLRQSIGFIPRLFRHFSLCAHRNIQECGNRTVADHVDHQHGNQQECHNALSAEYKSGFSVYFVGCRCKQHNDQGCQCASNPDQIRFAGVYDHHNVFRAGLNSASFEQRGDDFYPCNNQRCDDQNDDQRLNPLVFHSNPPYYKSETSGFCFSDCILSRHTATFGLFVEYCRFYGKYCKRKGVSPIKGAIRLYLRRNEAD